MDKNKTVFQEGNIKTRFSVFIVLAAILLISGFFFFELSWATVKDYPILGIPLGIIIFSYLGGLSKIIHTIYQGVKIEFFFKWFIVNSFGSILFGGAVFLLISSIVDTQKEYLLFPIVFVAAYFSNVFIAQFAAHILDIVFAKSASKTTDSSILDDTNDSNDAT
jgi:hypothetical protein